MTWIYNWPAWLFLLVATILTCAMTTFSLIWFRRSRFHRSELTHNDVAGPVVTTAGTILAVMLSFMVVAVWQQFDQSAANVQIEAASLSDLYTISYGLPEPIRSSVQSQTRSYLQTVISREWPLMRIGGTSHKARHDLYSLYRTLAQLRSVTADQGQTRAEALQELQRAIDARRRRIYDNQEGIPPTLWFVMITTSVITIGFIFFFRMHDERTHILFTTALTIIVVIVCVLIAELDYPFRGDISISPTSLQNTMNYITEITTQ